MNHGTSQCGEIQGMKYGPGKSPVEPATIVSDAATGLKDREQGTKGTKEQTHGA